MPVQTISPADFAKTLPAHPLIIDVRTPAEFARAHIPNARLIPLDQLDPAAITKLRSNPNEPLYILCEKGARAAKACEKLAAAGLPNVLSVDGGTVACEHAGLPVLRDPPACTISLERQVRIAAGALTFTGTALGFFLHPALLLLPAFIGAGLTFAGLTDTCGMAMLLAKMPWNQTRPQTP